MLIHRFAFNPFGENTYIIWDANTLQCVIIDPGMMSVHEENVLQNFIDTNKLIVTQVINTHMHIDHVVGNQFAVDKWHVPLAAHKSDLFLGKRVKEQAAMFGLDARVVESEVTSFLEDGDIIKIGDGELHVLHLPGHSPGGIALYDKEDGFVVTGDSLFQMSIGRTDLPGGDYNQLINAIKDKLMTLPPDTIVYPGHGEPTTIKNELNHNPFLR